MGVFFLKFSKLKTNSNFSGVSNIQLELIMLKNLIRKHDLLIPIINYKPEILSFKNLSRIFV